MGVDRRLAALDGAFQSWVTCIDELPADRFLSSMEEGSPRDRIARLIGWNQLSVIGAKDIMAGRSPAYHRDFANAYAQVNRDLVARERSTDRAALLEKLTTSHAATVQFFQGVPGDAWNTDFGVRHPDGGPATVRRCLEELTRAYLNATDDVVSALQTE
jgi:hypothetical protein